MKTSSKKEQIQEEQSEQQERVQLRKLLAKLKGRELFPESNALAKKMLENIQVITKRL